MLNLRFSKKFNKDIKLLKRRNYDLKKLKDVILTLREQNKLSEKYKDHALSGNYSEYRECHIEPDWLLIYKIDNKQLILVLTRTGSHSDLF